MRGRGWGPRTLHLLGRFVAFWWAACRGALVLRRVLQGTFARIPGSLQPFLRTCGGMAGEPCLVLRAFSAASNLSFANVEEGRELPAELRCGCSGALVRLLLEHYVARARGLTFRALRLRPCSLHGRGALLRILQGTFARIPGSLQPFLRTCGGMAGESCLVLRAFSAASNLSFANVEEGREQPAELRCGCGGALVRLLLEHYVARARSLTFRALRLRPCFLQGRGAPLHFGPSHSDTPAWVGGQERGACGGRDRGPRTSSPLGCFRALWWAARWGASGALAGSGGQTRCPPGLPSGGSGRDGEPPPRGAPWETASRSGLQGAPPKEGEGSERRFVSFVVFFL